MTRGRAGLRLDAAHASGDGGFADDGDQADVAGARDMCAAAEFDREGGVCPGGAAHRHDAHLIAVFLAEQCPGAGCDCVVDGHEARLDGRIFEDGSVGRVFDDDQILGADRSGVRDIETQPIGCDERALLRDVVAERQAQRLMQKVSRGMVGADRGMAGAVDR